MSLAILMIITFITAHLIADGFLQSRDIAKRKSSSLKALIVHLLYIFLVTLLSGTIVIILYTIFVENLTLWYLVKVLVFSALNALIHGIIDASIWNFYKIKVISDHYDFKSALMCIKNKRKRKILLGNLKDFKYYEDKWFYDTIMTDQYLHTLTIVLLSFLMF
jgi:hypothetical protein